MNAVVRRYRVLPVHREEVAGVEVTAGQILFLTDAEALYELDLGQIELIDQDPVPPLPQPDPVKGTDIISLLRDRLPYRFDVETLSAYILQRTTGQASDAAEAAAIATTKAAEVALDASAVAADRAAVVQVRADTQAARTATETARDQAVANNAAGQLTFGTLAALTAYTPPDQTKTYYADVVGGKFRYIWAGASPWTVTNIPTLLGLNAALEKLAPLDIPYMGVGVPDIVDGLTDEAGRLLGGISTEGAAEGAAFDGMTRSVGYPYMGVTVPDLLDVSVDETGGIIDGTTFDGRPAGLRFDEWAQTAPTAVPYMGGDCPGGPGDIVDGEWSEDGDLGHGITSTGRFSGAAVDALRDEFPVLPVLGQGPVVYTKPYLGKETIYVIDGDGERRLTDGTFDALYPVVVGGGTAVKYASTRDGTLRLWRAPLDGGPHIKSLSNVVRHIIINGQSNATRFAPAGSTSGRITQVFSTPHQVLQFVGGLYPHFPNGSQVSPADPIPDANLAGFVPLSTLYNGTSVNLEATGFGLAEMLAAALPQQILLLSNHAVPGYSHAQLKPGTVPWENLIKSAVAGKRVSFALGLGHVGTDVIHKHGEADAQNANYLDCIGEIAFTARKQLRAITRQDIPVRVWLTQIANWTSPGAGSKATASSMLAQLAAHVQGIAILVCPTYHLPHDAGIAPGDGIHIPAYGIRSLDEKIAQALLIGTGWQPLRPVSVVYSGGVITVSFVGRTGPLRFNVHDQSGNPNGVSDPGQYGFRLIDGAGGSATITNVALSSDATQIIITPSAAPRAGAMLGYADVGTPGAAGGPLTGPRGCLCDSDPQAPSAVLRQHRITALGQTAQQAADPLSNWCVVFREPIAVS